jgi:hypothetical protein
MIPKSMYLACVVLAGQSCVSLFGQEKGAGDQMVAPHWQFSAVSFTRSGEGMPPGGAPNALKLTGDSYRNMALTKAFVEGTEIRVLAVQSYFNTSDEVVALSVYLPPTIPETDATFHIEYAKVNTLQVPSQVVPEIENTGVIRYRLNHCQVSLLEWPKR